MTGTPIDLASLATPVPSRRSLPALLLPGVAKPGIDLFDLEVTALRVLPCQPGFTTARLAIRQGDTRAAAAFTPAQLRRLARHLGDVADLLDPPPPEDRRP